MNWRVACWLFRQLADAQEIAEAAAARAGGRSPGSSGRIASVPTPEAYGGASQQAVTLSNLRDPQTSQTSLHLG